jgi:predicted DNA-binding transcriptional regulator AlpA
MPDKINSQAFADYLSIKSKAITRYSKADDTFPFARTIGRTRFYLKSDINRWLSLKAGKFIDINKDELLTSEEVQITLNRSHAWLYEKVREGEIPKPFKVAKRVNYWLKRDIDAYFMKQ